MRPVLLGVALGLSVLTSLPVSFVSAQCPESPIANYTSGGSALCPCFVMGEEAGAVFTAPAGDYPLEIIRVGIGWGSQFGGSPASLEEAVKIYEGGLPNPGTPIFELPGPVLNDGVINQYNLDPLAGEIIVDSGPFTVTLEFLNENSGNIFAPSMIYDGNGCQAGKNVVKAIPGGWLNACALGVTGDWVVFAIYRPCVPAQNGVGDPVVVSTHPAWLFPAAPNPVVRSTRLSFVLREEGRATLTVFDVAGRRVRVVADEAFEAGVHEVEWDAAREDGRAAAPGVYFAELIAGGERHVQKLLVAR